MNYSLPLELFDLSERLALLLNYKDKEKLDLVSKLQWLWIVQKTARIAKHTQKKQLQT